MTEPNVKELDALVSWATIEQAKKDAGLPSEWDQGYWAKQNKVSCGTACCLAGQAVARAGGVFDFSSPVAHTRHGATMTSDALLPDGRRVDIEKYAARVLGLTSDQAGVLFEGDNTLPYIRWVVEQIKAGEECPDDFPDWVRFNSDDPDGEEDW